jgi:hypothetical protein
MRKTLCFFFDKKMSDDDQGALSEWEWSAIVHANPALLRKRFSNNISREDQLLPGPLSMGVWK